MPAPWAESTNNTNDMEEDNKTPGLFDGIFQDPAKSYQEHLFGMPFDGNFVRYDLEQKFFGFDIFDDDDK